MGFSKSLAQLSCFPRREEDIDEFRLHGQAELRAMFLNKEEVDWKAVMMKAHELEVREAELLQKQELEEQRKQEKQSRGRRKKYERLGLFGRNQINSCEDETDDMSINLLPKFRDWNRPSSIESKGDTSYQTLSDDSSSGSLSDDEKLNMRSYLIPNKTSL